MRGGVWAVWVVATLGFAGSASAQLGSHRELPPVTGDPFTDPIFSPPSTGAKPGTLYDAVTANDPFAIPAPADRAPRVGDACACTCGPGFTTWLVAEWLIGRTRGPSVSPIVTTGPASAGLLAGAVGQPATIPLFGGRRILNDWRSGLRVEAGAWFDDHRTGLSGRLYSLFSDSEHSIVRSGGAPVV